MTRATRATRATAPAAAQASQASQAEASQATAESINPLAVRLADLPAMGDQLADLDIAAILASMEQAAIEQRKKAIAEKEAKEKEQLWGPLTENQRKELARLHSVALRFKPLKTKKPPTAWINYRASRSDGASSEPAFTSSGQKITSGFCPPELKTTADQNRYTFSLLACSVLKVKGMLKIGEFLTLSAFSKAEFKTQADALDTLKNALPGYELRWSSEFSGNPRAIEINPRDSATLPEWPGCAIFYLKASHLIAKEAQGTDTEQQEEQQEEQA